MGTLNPRVTTLGVAAPVPETGIAAVEAISVLASSNKAIVTVPEPTG